MSGETRYEKGELMDERRRSPREGQKKRRKRRVGKEERKERKKTSASTSSPGAYSSQTKTRSGPLNLT